MLPHFNDERLARYLPRAKKLLGRSHRSMRSISVVSCKKDLSAASSRKLDGVEDQRVSKLPAWHITKQIPSLN